MPLFNRHPRTADSVVYQEVTRENDSRETVISVPNLARALAENPADSIRNVGNYRSRAAHQLIAFVMQEQDPPTTTPQDTCQ